MEPAPRAKARFEWLRQTWRCSFRAESFVRMCGHGERQYCQFVSPAILGTMSQTGFGIEDRAMHPSPPSFETDSRFPSGPWTGFYLMPHTGSRRHPTALTITFVDGIMTGRGADAVGPFTVQGFYSTDDGKCNWVKHYLGKHDVLYSGYNEGKGIWGMWEIPPFKGGFHIWPEGMEDPTRPTLREEADPPVELRDETPVGEEVVVGS